MQLCETRSRQETQGVQLGQDGAAERRYSSWAKWPNFWTLCSHGWLSSLGPGPVDLHKPMRSMDLLASDALDSCLYQEQGFLGYVHLAESARRQGSPTGPGV